MHNAHIAVHFSRTRNPDGIVIVQPRNSDGTFRSPDPNHANLASTGHMTRNGVTVRKLLR